MSLHIYLNVRSVNLDTNNIGNQCFSRREWPSFTTLIILALGSTSLSIAGGGGGGGRTEGGCSPAGGGLGVCPSQVCVSPITRFPTMSESSENDLIEMSGKFVNQVSHHV